MLAYDPTLPKYARHRPWVLATRCDEGFCDYDGNSVAVQGWIDLPEPRPEPTGWTPATGTIRIVECSGEGWTCNGKPVEVPWRWLIFVEKPDGEYDEYRDTDMARTFEEAERKALRWQDKLGLPIVTVPLDEKVIPLFPARTKQ